MSEPGSGKTPGQIAYEKFRDEEYRQHHRLWNRWAELPPEEVAKWEEAALLEADR
jgi:hypothetical protein